MHWIKEMVAQDSPNGHDSMRVIVIINSNLFYHTSVGRRRVGNDRIPCDTLRNNEFCDPMYPRDWTQVHPISLYIDLQNDARSRRKRNRE